MNYALDEALISDLLLNFPLLIYPLFLCRTLGVVESIISILALHLSW
jgi:hypothetical protein